MTVLLRGGLVWDGTVSQPEPRDVLLDGDRISAVTACGETAAHDDDTLVVDLDGAFMMPGLIDCHVHLVWSGEPDPASQVAVQGPQTTTVRAVVNAQSQLAAGVTTVRDLGSVDDIAITLARAVDRADLEGPTIIASGRTVIMTGGHDPFWGVFADGPEEVVKAVRQQVYAGADVIKTAATGGAYGRSEGEEVGQSELSYEELAALTAEAHRRGRKVAAHALGAEGITNAVRAGVDTIEHGVFLTERTATQMRAQGTVLCPTLAIYRVLASDVAVPGYARAKAQQVVGAHRESLRMAVDLGIPVVAGTDAGSCSLPHPAIVDELEVLHEYGLSTLDCLRAATSRAADAVDRAGAGVIQPGAVADLLVVEDSPLDDLAALRRPFAVVRAGRTLRSLPSHVRRVAAVH